MNSNGNGKRQRNRDCNYNATNTRNSGARPIARGMTMAIATTITAIVIATAYHWQLLGEGAHMFLLLGKSRILSQLEYSRDSDLHN